MPTYETYSVLFVIKDFKSQKKILANKERVSYFSHFAKKKKIKPKTKTKYKKKPQQKQTKHTTKQNKNDFTAICFIEIHI